MRWTVTNIPAVSNVGCRVANLMQPLYPHIILLLFVLGAVLVWLAYLSWQRRPAPGAAALAGLLLAIAWWVACYGLELSSNNLPTALFWLKMRFFGIAAIPPGWLIFILQYTDRERWLTRRKRGALCIMPALTLALLWTNEYHHLLFVSERLLPFGNLNLLKLETGTWFWVNAVYIYAFSLSGAVLLLRNILGLPRHQQKQKLTMLAALVALAAPWASNVLFLLQVPPFADIDLTPFTFGISGLLVFSSLFGFRLFELVPVARAAILENINDAVIVIDGQSRLIDLNPAAAALLGKPAAGLIGRPRQEVFTLWPELEALLNANPQSLSELRLSRSVPERTFEALISPLLAQGKHLRGNLIVLHEITHRQQAAETLRRQTEVIRTLLSISEAIGSTLDLSKLVDRILMAAHRLLTDVRTAVWIWDEASGCLIPALPQTGEYSGWLLPTELRSPFAALRLRPDQMPLIAALKDSYQPVVIDDTQKTDLLPSELAEKYNARSLLIIPLHFQERFLGALYIDHTRLHTFSSEEIELAGALARQASLALERARLYTQSQQDAAEIAALYRASSPLVNPGGDVRALAAQIAHAVTQEFDSAHCGVLLLDETRHELILAAQDGHILLTPVPLPLDGPGLTVEAALTGQSIYAPDVSHNPLYVLGAAETCSELAIPLQAGGRIIGVLNLESPNCDAFDGRSQRILAAYAERAALALANAQLFEAEARQSRQMALLNAITHSALGSDDFHAVLQSSADRLGEIFHADGCFITLWDDEKQTTLPGAAFGPLSDFYQHLPPANTKPTITSAALKAGRPIIVEDTFQTPYLSPEIASLFPFHSALGLPLIANEQKLGAALITYIDQHRFSETEIAMGELAAAQIALALTKSRALESAQRRAIEAETLRKATAALASDLDLQQALDNILDQLAKVIPYDSACIFLMKENALHAVAGRGLPNPGLIVGRDFPADDPLMLTAYQGNGYLILEDAQLHPAFSKWGETSYVRGWLGVSLVRHNRLIGYLTLDSRTVGAFRAEHATQAQALASQAAIAIENARLYQSAKEAASRRTVLHRVSQEILAASLEPEQVYQAIHRAAEQLMIAQAFVIVIFDEAADAFEAVYLVDRGGRYPSEHVPKGQGLVSQVVASGKTLNIANLDNFDASGAVHFGDPDHVRSILAVPLWLGGKIMGMISAQSYLPDAYTLEEQSLLELLAAHAAVALDNARLFREVQRLAITDPLTGPYNRRGLFEMGQREIERYRRFGRPLSIIILDIDHFKEINDSFGHAIGDQVLRGLAYCIRQHIREVDSLGRYGGEEFVILLPETPREAAAQAAERLRLQIASSPIQTTNGVLTITVSLGVAQFNEKTADLDALIDRADAAMYAAKQSGRNRVVVGD